MFETCVRYGQNRFTFCWQYVLKLLNICLMYVNNLSIFQNVSVICSKTNQIMFQICLLYFQKVINPFKMCSKSVCNMSKVCSKYGHNLFAKCPNYVEHLLNVGSKYVENMSKFDSKYVPKLPKIRPKSVGNLSKYIQNMYIFCS